MTRQWLSDPSFMCIRHLTGEHAETHSFLTKMHQGHSLDGFIEADMFFGAKFVKARHDLLAMFLEGHGTPLEIDSKLENQYPFIVPTIEAVTNSVNTLVTRCEYCRAKHHITH